MSGFIGRGGALSKTQTVEERVWFNRSKDYQSTSSPPLFLRDSRASETRARVKNTPREKRRHAACRLFSRWVIFTSVRVSLALYYP